jgi:hypothetical protein
MYSQKRNCAASVLVSTSCICDCERFIYCHDVRIGSAAAKFHFWENLFRISGIMSLHFAVSLERLYRAFDWSQMIGCTRFREKAFIPQLQIHFLDEIALPVYRYLCISDMVSYRCNSCKGEGGGGWSRCLSEAIFAHPHHKGSLFTYMQAGWAGNFKTFSLGSMVTVYFDCSHHSTRPPWCVCRTAENYVLNAKTT